MSGFETYNTGLMYNINRPLLLFGVDVQWAIMGIVFCIIAMLIHVMIGIVVLIGFISGLSFVSSKKKAGHGDYLRSYLSAGGRPELITDNSHISLLKIKKN